MTTTTMRRRGVKSVSVPATYEGMATAFREASDALLALEERAHDFKSGGTARIISAARSIMGTLARASEAKEFSADAQWLIRHAVTVSETVLKMNHEATEPAAAQEQGS